jgi:hypothetical protein
MRCKEFDAHIDEMLSGVLHPDANQHMRQCERCTSYFRAQTVLQNGLRALAAAPAAGPSRATDRAVMDSYRRLQERRMSAAAQPPDSAARPAARLFTFPSRGPAARGRRAPWTGVAVAAMLLAVAGSSIRLWHGVSTVNAPSVATTQAPGSAASPSVALASLAPGSSGTNSAAGRHPALRQARLGSGRGSSAERSAAPEALAEAGPVLAKASLTAADGGTGGSGPEMQQPANTSSIMHLASTADNGSAGQSASSTWPGYSNLMYCDPVVCSGPMQVVHIKVPVEQVRPGVGQTEGKSFVNADVVVGPDGVARAIRVAN